MESTKKFTGKADIYSKYRPSYPKEYINYLISANSLSSTSVIADIGSGTGILSGQLLEKRLEVICVEPNADMRTLAENQLKGFSRYLSVNGSAEDTTLQEKSIDLITVAQAFHWFDKERFKAECRRILKQNSKIALVWNSRDFSSEIIQENALICKKMCPSFNGFSGGMEESPEIIQGFYGDGNFEIITFQNDLQLDLDGFIGRNLSSSYAPKSTDVNYDAFISALTDLFDKYSENNMITMPNNTRSYLGCV